MADPSRAMMGDQRADHCTERESGNVDRLRKQLIESVGGDLRDLIDLPGCRHIARITEGREVGAPDLTVLRQRFDIGRPVLPAAATAMKQR